MLITKSWINAHKTAGGSWNRKQIEALGLSWPPSKGWQKRAVGQKLTPNQQLAFEHQAGTRSKGTKADRMFQALSDRVVVLEKQLEELSKFVRAQAI